MSTDMIESDARIFRFGQYDRKDFGVSRDEFIAANGERGTIPVGFDPINLKHYEGKTSALDGMTGTVDFEVQGDEVLGKVKLPAWMDEVRKKLGLKISSVLGRIGKELRKIDLVDKPHIPDAVFFDNDQPDVVIFEDEEPVEFADEGRQEYAQQQHELIAGMAHHAKLDFCKPPKSVGFDKEDPRERALRVAHDHTISEGGAYCPGMNHHHHEEVSMGDELEDLQAENERLQAELKAKEVAFAEETPREKALRLKVEAMEVEAARKDAVTFADSVTKGDGRRALPAERASIIDSYQRNAALDARLGDTVTFSEDGKTQKTGSYLDAYKASVFIRPIIKVNAEDTVGFDLDSEPASTGKDEDAAAAKRREENIAWTKKRQANS
jgi:hypothetical protein